MISIAICDDDATDLKGVKFAVEYIMRKSLLQYEIEEYNTGDKLLKAARTFDLVFLDIMLGAQSGIEIGKLLYRKNRYTKIIFQSYFPQYCQDALNKSHAFAFLEKPLQINLLEEQIREFMICRTKMQKIHVEFHNVTYLSDGIEFAKASLVLPVNHILYFEYLKSQKKIAIITSKQKFIFSETMRELEERMYPLGFATSCRGLLINIEKIMRIKGYTILMNNGEQLPLSQRRVSQFKERMNEFIHNSY